MSAAPILEREMEDVIARCPELFIEPGLKLLKRQVIIDGKRPDLLFKDNLERHLLVEIQRDKLDENHVQRHIYYFWNYRKKYPETHPRLLFFANRIVFQHKDFFSFHGYEYREMPDPEFRTRMGQCHGIPVQLPESVHETPGVLPISFQELLYDIQRHPMVYCYKMLLLIEMVDNSDADGRVTLDTLADRFRSFFERRAALGLAEENPRRRHNSLSGRTLSYWKETIRSQPVKRLGTRFLLDEHGSIRWSPEIWSQWSPDLKREIRDTAMSRLVDYFNRYVPGGYV